MGKCENARKRHSQREVRRPERVDPGQGGGPEHALPGVPPQLVMQPIRRRQVPWSVGECSQRCYCLSPPQTQEELPQKEC